MGSEVCVVVVEEGGCGGAACTKKGCDGCLVELCCCGWGWGFTVGEEGREGRRRGLVRESQSEAVGVDGVEEGGALSFRVERRRGQSAVRIIGCLEETEE